MNPIVLPFEHVGWFDPRPMMKEMDSSRCRRLKFSFYEICQIGIVGGYVVLPPGL